MGGRREEERGREEGRRKEEGGRKEKEKVVVEVVGESIIRVQI